VRRVQGAYLRWGTAHSPAKDEKRAACAVCKAPISVGARPIPPPRKTHRVPARQALAAYRNTSSSPLDRSPISPDATHPG